ncbi:FAD-dependent oxidoreductase [Phenylobacterium sp. J367]|uniref:FAD-dependent oxidoreductase n=1 Tax=Phenylobacterium sp. J367 TaxID=2898435 RepID=UPI0021516D4F|nr:FAD-dependent oxidoreductase [Phenylobacterium sp. J367]MCR5880827.1 FAD-dependent oxidoreductase [Phenylobacterium sp. J367]
MVTRRAVVTAMAGAGVAAGQAGAAPAVHDVVVVGAGVFGAWTAWALAQAGKRVAVVDAYGAGHARASSGGESRVIRFSYGGDPLYSSMAQNSLADWKALSARTGEPVFHETGVLWFSPSGDEYMARSLDWLLRHGVEHRAMDLADLGAAYPQIVFRAGESGFLETRTGALIAGRGVRARLRDAKLEVTVARAEAPQAADAGLYSVAGLRTRNIVYACGPWLPKLFPEVLAGRITATRQEVFHFGAPAGDRRFAPPALPVWADFNGGDMVYGLPDLEGQGFKLAFDRHGPEVDPDTQERRVSDEGLARARAYLAQRFPGLAGAPLVMSRVCQYENSSNGDFLIDRLPGHDNVWLVGGGSGHGFKHGPAVGRRVAAHVLDAALAVEPRFSLATKGKVAARTVY